MWRPEFKVPIPSENKTKRLKIEIINKQKKKTIFIESKNYLPFADELC